MTKNKAGAPEHHISIIVSDNVYSKEINNKFFDSLFSCPFPVKIIVQRSMLENGNFPLKYLNKDNLLALHGDDFVKEARKRAGSKKVIVLKKPYIVSENAFEKIFSLNLNGKLFEIAAEKIISNLK